MKTKWKIIRLIFALCLGMGLLTISASAGMTTDISPGDWVAVSRDKQPEWCSYVSINEKFTLVNAPAQITARPGDTITLAYEGATVNSKIGAVIYSEALTVSSSEPVMIYIGTLAQVTTASGQVQLTIPLDIYCDDRHTIKVFSESRPGWNQDEGSNLFEIPLTVPTMAMEANVKGFTYRRPEPLDSFHRIFLGTENGPPVEWRVLDRKTNMGTYGAFLTSNHVYYDAGPFDTTPPYSAMWQGSDAQAWCKEYAERVFTDPELNAILSTTKTDGAYISEDGLIFASTSLQNDKLFFVSAEEFENLTYGISFWLKDYYVFRSPDASDLTKTAWFNLYSQVKPLSVFEPSRSGFKPFLNLDAEQVLFTSAADNRMHQDSFSAVPQFQPFEDKSRRWVWKMTAKDGNDFSAGASVEGKTFIATTQSSTLTISHASLASLSTDYTNVTAALTDWRGDILYYGSINNSTSARSSTVTIPAGLEVGEYTLSIYGEDWNDPKYTDYATGTPYTIPITVMEKEVPVLTDLSVRRHSAERVDVWVTSSMDGTVYYAYVKSGDPEPSKYFKHSYTLTALQQKTLYITGMPGVRMDENAYDFYFYVEPSSGENSRIYKAAIPAYGEADLSTEVDTGTLHFGAATQGAAPPAPQIVTITNTGNRLISLTRPTSSSYDIVYAEGSNYSIYPGESSSYSIRPKANLGVGSYEEEIIIQGRADSDASSETAKHTVSLNFTVQAGPGPILTGGGATRDDPENATVRFTSDQAGHYYYQVVDSGATVPLFDVSKEGTACGAGPQTISIGDLSGGAKDVYIVVKNQAGNVNAGSFKVTIPAPGEPVYSLAHAIHFGTVTEGYSVPAPQTTSVFNTGTRPVTLTASTANYFIINELSSGTIKTGEAATFAIRPKEDLKPGTYTEVLTIKGSNSKENKKANNIELFATFTVEAADQPSQRYSITASAGDNGSITPNGDVQVPAGNNQAFTITPNGGYEIDTVMVDGQNATDQVSDNRYTFANVRESHTINVTFKAQEGLQQYTISLSTEGGGTVGGGGTFAADTTVTVTASPSDGHQFVQWTENGAKVSTDASYTFSVTEDRSLVAVFQEEPAGPDQHTITASAGEHGSITPKGDVPVTAGNSQIFSIEPDNGYEIDAVTVDGQNATDQVSGKQYTFDNVQKDHTISVTFKVQEGPQPPDAITYTVTMEGGGADAEGSGSYAVGETVSIHAGTKADHSFQAWTTTDGVSFADANSASTTFPMPEKDVTVTATWTSTGGNPDDKGEHAITIDGAMSGGTITPDKSAAKEGDVVTLTVEADEGFRLVADSLRVYQTGESGNTVAVSNDRFTMPDYAVTVTAVFEKVEAPPVVTHTITYTLTNISKNASAPDAVETGEPLEVTLSAEQGYALPETVTVTMGDKSLAVEEDYAYDVGTGELSITAVTGNVVIEASGVAKGDGTQQVAAVTASPGPGTFPIPQAVELSTTTENAVIYYTTDKSEPNSNSTLYSLAIPVEQTMTIKAVAVKPGMDDSAVSTFDYTIDRAPVPEPDDIVSVTNPAGLRVDYGTEAAGVAWPATVQVRLSGGSEPRLAVAWDSGNYNGTTPGDQGFTGVLTLPEGVTNSRNLTASLVVTVGEQGPEAEAVTGVRVAPVNVSLYSNRGDKTVQLTAAVEPAHASNKGVTWSSGNDAVATVDAATGLVTITGANGTAVITATTEDGGFTGDCTVRVSTYVTSSSSSSGSSTTTTTKKNGDGSATKTETNRVTGTVTETTTRPDGTTEIRETKKDGTVTETVKDKESNQTIVETQKDGTVTETVTRKDGFMRETVTRPDGSRVITVTTADGVKAEVEQDAEGNISAEVTIPEKAMEGEGPVALPIPAVDTSKGNILTITVPEGTEVQVEAPVKAVTAATVAVVMKEDGTETIVKTSVPRENGLVLTVTGKMTVKIVENRKEFADVDGEHWAAEAVAFVTSRELFNGTGENTFDPDATTSRAMLFTVLARLDGQETTGGELWYAKAMDWAQSAGISDGANPDGTITREQLATMLYRYVGNPAAEAEGKTFADGGQVSGWAAEAMDWAVKAGILTGKNGDRLDPAGIATRTEVAVMLQRFVVHLAE